MTQQNRNFCDFLYSGKTLQNKCLLALKVPCSNTLTRWLTAHRDVAGLCLQPFSSRGDVPVLSGKSKFSLRSWLWPLGLFGVQEERVGAPHTTPGRAQPAQPHEIPKAPVWQLHPAAFPWGAAVAWKSIFPKGCQGTCTGAGATGAESSDGAGVTNNGSV